MRSSSTISWKLREYRKSPTSTLAALPQTALAVLRPRRRSDSSTTSSCSSVAVWMNSITAASWCASLGAAMAAARPRGEQQQHRPQPLAAGADDVFGDLVDQHHVGRQAAPDQRIDRRHVGARQGLDRRPGHGLGDWAGGVACERSGCRAGGDYTERAPAKPRRAVPKGPPRRQRADGRGRRGILQSSVARISGDHRRTDHGTRHQQGDPGRQPRQRSRNQVHPGRHGDHHAQPGHHQRRARTRKAADPGKDRMAPGQAVRQDSARSPAST